MFANSDATFRSRGLTFVFFEIFAASEHGRSFKGVNVYRQNEKSFLDFE